MYTAREPENFLPQGQNFTKRVFLCKRGKWNVSLKMGSFLFVSSLKLFCLFELKIFYIFCSLEQAFIHECKKIIACKTYTKWAKSNTLCLINKKAFLRNSSLPSARKWRSSTIYSEASPYLSTYSLFNLKSELFREISSP